MTSTTYTMNFLPKDIEDIIMDYKNDLEKIKCDECKNLLDGKYEDVICGNCNGCFDYCCECCNCERCDENVNEIYINWCEDCNEYFCDECENETIKIGERHICKKCFKDEYLYCIKRQEYSSIDYYYIINKYTKEWNLKIGIHVLDKNEPPVSFDYYEYGDEFDFSVIRKNGYYYKEYKIKEMCSYDFLDFLDNLDLDLDNDFEEEKEDNSGEEDDSDEEKEEDEVVCIYKDFKIKKLKEICKEKNIIGYSKLKRENIIQLLKDVDYYNVSTFENEEELNKYKYIFNHFNKNILKKYLDFGINKIKYNKKDKKSVLIEKLIKKCRKEGGF